MQAIILAAGKSTRCYPLTLTRPKPLLPLANRPLIFYHLEALVGLAKEIIIVIGYHGEMIKGVLGKSYQGIPIRYHVQKGLNGTGDALLQTAHLVKAKFLLINGDDYYSRDDLHKLARHENAVLVAERKDPEHFGVVASRNGRLVDITEKPKTPKSGLVNCAAYCFSHAFLEMLEHMKPTKRAELELPCAITKYADTAEIAVQKAEGAWYPLTHAWSLLEANQGVLAGLKASIEGTVEPGATVKGKLVLGPGSIVKAGAYLEGDILVGADTVLGPNCYIRGWTTIGSRCKVGNAVEIKNSILFDGAKVAHLSYFGDSVLGYNCNAGAGTITANLRHDNANVKSLCRGELIDTGNRKLGTIWGDGVHTGINTSIYPGRKLWPNATTRPGQIVDKDIQAD
jgi:UDP-N-acetylglucosamine diphosphorylase / glucose-1-phosphate thymidylyltransferase / UDP-N-acetylgalactosamine diphosphorylase / glucosamine-1-phosphate N-acetyltransferase / galactosamine-1-phosphate N-acetyltransferase